MLLHARVSRQSGYDPWIWTKMRGHGQTKPGYQPQAARSAEIAPQLRPHEPRGLREPRMHHQHLERRHFRLVPATLPVPPTRPPRAPNSREVYRAHVEAGAPEQPPEHVP